MIEIEIIGHYFNDNTPIFLEHKKKIGKVIDSYKNNNNEVITKIIIDNKYANLSIFTSHTVRTCHGCKQMIESYQLKRCSNCKMAYYCSKECQKKDWQKHKIFCYDK